MENKARLILEGKHAEPHLKRKVGDSVSHTIKGKITRIEQGEHNDSPMNSSEKNSKPKRHQFKRVEIEADESQAESAGETPEEEALEKHQIGSKPIAGFKKK